jgi:hypothetical protein
MILKGVVKQKIKFKFVVFSAYGVPIVNGAKIKIFVN